MVPQLGPGTGQDLPGIRLTEVEAGGVEDQVPVPVADALVAAKVDAAGKQRPHGQAEGPKDAIALRPMGQAADDPRFSAADRELGERELDRHSMRQGAELVGRDVRGHPHAPHRAAVDERVHHQVGA